MFLFIHSFAKPPPRTMTKEWQEATNEYLKVSSPASDAGWEVQLLQRLTEELICRKRNPIPSSESAARDTAGKVMCRASRRKSNDHKPLPKQYRMVRMNGEGIDISCTKKLYLVDLPWLPKCTTAAATIAFRQLSPQESMSFLICDYRASLPSIICILFVFAGDY